MAIHNKLSEAKKKMFPVKKGCDAIFEDPAPLRDEHPRRRGHGDIGNVHVWHWLFGQIHE